VTWDVSCSGNETELTPISNLKLRRATRPRATHHRGAFPGTIRSLTGTYSFLIESMPTM
jgi:hypothetical protein